MNPRVGDIQGNVSFMKEILRKGVEEKFDLVVFPELAISGYPPQDLLERKSFAFRCEEALYELASCLKGETRAITGFVEPNKSGRGKPFHNSAGLLQNGKVRALYRKMLLPSYDVFDETRWFEPGTLPVVFEMNNFRFGITICEDVWSDHPFAGRHLYSRDPVSELAFLGVNFIINISASPFSTDKRKLRREVLSASARKSGVSILYCNLVGGNDELLFDGGSFAVDEKGNIVAGAVEFEEDLLEISIDESGQIYGKNIELSQRQEEILKKALEMGIRDYVRKCGQTSVWLGLSGGVDSALVACLACGSLGAQNVGCLSMPTRFTQEASVEDAKKLSQKLGVNLIIVPIEEMFCKVTELLNPHFSGKPFDVTEENIQARIRGLLLMAFSNKFGGLVLATGNKSELASGYSTLYGDMVGGLAPIGDIYKTQVYSITRLINQDGEVIPARIVERAPSAELRPQQTDQDTLPPYEVLDRVLYMYLEEGRDIEGIIEAGFERTLVERVVDMVRRAEFKRRQAPPVLKVSERAFGIGRRYPVAQNYRG